LDTANPINVIPRCAIIGSAAATRPRAAARIGPVDPVALAIVCERVARVKSSKRKRSTTVRPVRCAERIRRVIRSMRPMTTASSSAGVRR
jgi:hypothetical protein